MTKVCTTIKQSRKLFELGIDIKTADMYYMYRHWEIDENTVGAQSDAHIGFDPNSYYGTDNGKTYHYVPAWSLSALLKYLQKFRAQGYIPILFPTENKWILNFVERGHGTICKVACYDPVDTCVGTILTIVPILKLRGINIL